MTCSCCLITLFHWFSPHLLAFWTLIVVVEFSVRCDGHREAEGLVQLLRQLLPTVVMVPAFMCTV